MSKLVLGDTYSRAEISKIFGGGSSIDYLPVVHGEVVCVCITEKDNQDTTTPNPKILVGKGPRIISTAKMFLKQTKAIPMFLRQKANEWKYMGDFRAVSEITDPALVMSIGVASNRFDVVSVLNLEH